jgi:predicted nucleic acid-binding protein
MILIDTNVWIDHFIAALPEMQEAAADGLYGHPYVVAELALGRLVDRAQTFGFLAELPILLPVRHFEIMAMIEKDELFGTGLQFVDLHLLASVRVTADCKLWTRDKRLRAAAERFGVAADLN